MLLLVNSLAMQSYYNAEKAKIARKVWASKFLFVFLCPAFVCFLSALGAFLSQAAKDRNMVLLQKLAAKKGNHFELPPDDQLENKMLGP